jgi:hypothetical protein
MAKWLLYLPFAVQGLSMLFDELYFHRKRGLGLWEKIGHPMDTMTVIACFLFLNVTTYSENNLLIFIGLSVFSCLFITKDEFVHTELCEAKENWLHAVLFVTHPIALGAAALIWKEDPTSTFLQMQLYVLVFVLSYQIIYWSVPWKKS